MPFTGVYLTKLGGHESSPDGCPDDCEACKKEGIATDCNLLLDHADALETAAAHSADGHDLIAAIRLATEHLGSAYELPYQLNPEN